MHHVKPTWLCWVGHMHKDAFVLMEQQQPDDERDKVNMATHTKRRYRLGGVALWECFPTWLHKRGHSGATHRWLSDSILTHSCHSDSLFIGCKVLPDALIFFALTMTSHLLMPLLTFVWLVFPPICSMGWKWSLCLKLLLLLDDNLGHADQKIHTKDVWVTKFGTWDLGEIMNAYVGWTLLLYELMIQWVDLFTWSIINHGCSVERSRVSVDKTLGELLSLHDQVIWRLSQFHPHNSSRYVL